MNSHFPITGCSSYAAYEQLTNNKGMLSGWSYVQLSPMNNLSHIVQPEMPHPFIPQVPICYTRNQQITPPIASFRVGQMWHPPYQPLNSVYTPVVRADHMTVEQTAAWVRTLGLVHMWEEADEYAQNFAKHNIWGYLLQKLTNDTLKQELGISKYEHRHEIMLAIRCLFPMAVTNHLVEKDAEQRSESQSPMLESVRSLKGDVSQLQIERSPSLSSAMTFSLCNRAIDQEEHKKEVMKWVGPSRSLLAASSPKDLSFNEEEKSTRATPTHPVIYKTLRKVKLRLRKAGHSKNIGYLPKGSVVVINQIKGRSGRVVFQNKDGKYVKVGWVTLYTQNKQQLLKKINPKMTNEGSEILTVKATKDERILDVREQ